MPMDMMMNRRIRPPRRINTFGELADWLATFPRNWSIAVWGADSVVREDIHINESSISTILEADGDEVEW